MRVFVLGGCGRQGSVIAQDLAKEHEVYAFDIVNRTNHPVKFHKADCSSYNELRTWLPKADLVVGALPSHLGLNAMMAAIDSGVHYVDISFCEFDVAAFNSGAMHKRLTVLHDCGIAPGLSNLVAGQALKQGAQDIRIFVGGIAQTPEEDYIVTWSPEDLYEEYVRPARIIENGSVQTIKALSNTPITLADVGLQAYVTDGLRSLLSKAHMITNMAEYTLRYPGHIDSLDIESFDKEGFVKYIQKKYRSGTDDVLHMTIIADDRRANLKVEGDTRLSAMAKCTAFSCSAFAQLVAGGDYKRLGVIPPEDVALDNDAYKFVLDRLSERGIEFDTKYPFL